MSLVMSSSKMKSEYWGTLNSFQESMSSPRDRRNSCRAGPAGTCGSGTTTVSGGANGRPELLAVRQQRSGPECPPAVRRRSSASCSYFAAGAQAEDVSFSLKLNRSIFTIALRFLLAIDMWLSKRLGVCACEESPWGSIRPLVRLVELSGHVVPWLLGTVYSLLRVDTVLEQEVLLNLALALLMDMLLVRIVKTLVRRRMPSQNRSDLLATYFVERYSFPSGHATRAVMCARFLLARLVDTSSMRALVLGWAALVSLSRLLLARHYVTDVGFGLAMGYCQYSLVERLWVTWKHMQDVLLMLLGETLYTRIRKS